MERLGIWTGSNCTDSTGPPLFPNKVK